MTANEHDPLHQGRIQVEFEWEHLDPQADGHPAVALPLTGTTRQGLEAKYRHRAGSPNVFIGNDKQPAAHADAGIGHCDQHSDSEPAHAQPAILGTKIAQGSKTVLINNFHAARYGHKGTCRRFA